MILSVSKRSTENVATVFDVVLCWMTFDLCADVFITLKWINLRCSKSTLRGIIIEVGLFAAATIIALGWTAGFLLVPTHGHPDRWCRDIGNNSTFDPSVASAVWLVPLGFLGLINLGNVVLVILQLSVAANLVQKIQGRESEVIQRLQSYGFEISALIIVLSVQLVNVIAIVDEGSLRTEAEWKSVITILAVSDTISPFGFLALFVWKTFRGLCHQCCYGDIDRRDAYRQIQRQNGRGRTSMTYHTCDNAGTTTRTYYTCDESQPPEWFQVH